MKNRQPHVFGHKCFNCQKKHHTTWHCTFDQTRSTTQGFYICPASWSYSLDTQVSGERVATRLCLPRASDSKGGCSLSTEALVEVQVALQDSVTVQSTTLRWNRGQVIPLYQLPYYDLKLPCWRFTPLQALQHGLYIFARCRHAIEVYWTCIC